MRISDWSSDVCSSDLAAAQVDHAALGDAAARGRLELLTPLAKAHATDVGCLVTSLGVPVHGGMGYIEETGAAQDLRDARLTPIYEDTRSEERRVGQEWVSPCRFRWSQKHSKKKKKKEQTKTK